MARDNISGTSTKSGGVIGFLFLMPGRIIQWFMYMKVGKLKKYGKVREQTRLARSPIMTYVYSIMFWLGIILVVLQSQGIFHSNIY